MQKSIAHKEKIEISMETMKKILDYSPNEIYVLNKNGQVLYANKAYENHYGLKESDIIGKSNDEFFSKGYWKPSILPLVMSSKQETTITQVSYIGKEIITTAIPLLNENEEIELIITTGQDPNYKELLLSKESKAEPTKVEPIINPMTTNNKEMKNVVSLAQRVAKVDTTILIQGESGTGKGVLAKYIHEKSARRNGPFLSLNCATIPEHLLESELFGYVEGAFTGATKHGKEGLLEMANGGTIFLDEIGEISPSTQVKLLKVIQDLEFIPVGGRKVKKIDVRIISATNRNLHEMVQNKQFREDLYYRLHVINIHIPPLRKRKEDIIPLTNYFNTLFNKKYRVKRLISKEVLDVFYRYSWPGNIRQLENMIESLVVTSDSIIELRNLPDILFQKNNSSSTLLNTSDVTLQDALDDCEKSIIVNSYRKYRNTRSVAADLSISQSKASRLIRKYCKDIDFTID
ncbi:sigma-54 interaction domain-containing protein [Bacillus massiliigorillae]|uniref:sigma-54 interaction domain-containing protein n=1 Tax=Bacillus massiliigorillae TaxID=1243664 RepID=UPI0003AB492F|nr:sigma 54-interacting transcriptional regulator [Bacillus massiliigorillae]